MSRGIVVRSADIAAEQPGAGVAIRTVLDAGSAAGPGLIRRLAELAPGGQLADSTGDPGRCAGELWFVIAGTGRVSLAGQDEDAIVLRPDRGLRISPGMSYQIAADGDSALRLDLVTLPPHAAGRAAASAAALVSELAGCDVETTGDRQFRVLFGPDRRCEVATQFVGEIPPGRAPAHSHPYDEVVLILAGEGVAHIGGAEYPVGPGSCLHLPPGLMHCLENAGTSTMRVLGVFHPASSPAAKLAEHH